MYVYVLFLFAAFTAPLHGQEQSLSKVEVLAVLADVTRVQSSVQEAPES